MTVRPAPRSPSGYLNLLKPPGITSQQAVARVRHILGAAKAGHAGTLDPAAVGVLVISLGRATRLTRYVSGAAKRYRAEITFGVATDTLDAEGMVTAESSALQLSADRVSAVLDSFRGQISQTPPMHSALRRRGERLYRLARGGATVERPPRLVTIEHLSLLRFWPGDRPRALIEVTCSSGTYLRSLAADVGAAVDAPAYLSFLVRTRVGAFRLSDALTLDELAALADAGDFASAIAPLDAPLSRLPKVSLDAVQAAAARRGQRLVAPREQVRHPSDTQGGAPAEVALYNGSGGLLGVARGEFSPSIVTLQPRLIVADEK